jgi:hypothetical protein
MFAEIKNSTVVTFPYDYDTLIQKNPHTRFNKEDLLSMYADTEDNKSGNKLVNVVETSVPTFSKKTHKVVKEAAPVLVDNAWTLGWKVVALSEAEKTESAAAQAQSIRQSRNQKLKESDWTQVDDAPVNKAAWATYRQALRDLSSVANFPWVELPSEPV